MLQSKLAKVSQLTQTSLKVTKKWKFDIGLI